MHYSRPYISHLYRIAMKISICILLLFTILRTYAQSQATFGQFNIINRGGFRSNIPTPFPQCLTTELGKQLFEPSALQRLFDRKLFEENTKLTQERDRNIVLNNDDIMDFDEMQLRADNLNGPLLSRTATKAAEEILQELSCITNASITNQLNDALRAVRLPPNMCAFRSNAKCDGLTQYRTITGVCNNVQRPYQGSSQTAFGRLLPAAYDDGLSKPRSRSVLGDPLPGCRQISLAMGSKPNFDTSVNNLWVTYGQFVIHDITLSTPVTDSGRTPITSCSCDSKDTNMCNVIEIAANDPFMSGQKCMAVPATAQAFSNEICTLGAKEQMNANSHYIDLSVTYGSTRMTAANLRAGSNGLMKTMRLPGFKFDLLAGQREGKSCVDGTETQRCFAAGDSRVMENSVLTAVQAQWLRAHNFFADELVKFRPDWRSNDRILFEEARKVLTALHQRYVYEDWLPTLIGKEAVEKFLGDSRATTRYNPSVPGVIFNEAVTGVLRLHTFARDLVSRCQRDGKMINQLWFSDITSRCRFAYDTQTNGLDSFICGALYDFAFAGDTNYAQIFHHRLFESTTPQGETRRHDIVALNICRGREHGIPSYNAYREFCGLKRANSFQDFADVMTGESVQKLQMIYKHPDDVDLHIGGIHENPLPGALVGPVSACLIGIQFQHLKYGDRFFYTHEGEFTPDQMRSIVQYPNHCFVCHTTDIEQAPLDPFHPPNERSNPLQPCNRCPLLDFAPWRRPQ